MTAAPKRIQRKRAKGWRMPPNTVYVGRGSRWGNPFVLGRDGTAAECVRRYAEMLTPYRHHGEGSGLDHFLLSVANIEDIQTSLRGKNLACWCPLGQPCHADVLLELANKP
jgi:hypothetical protein